MYAFILIITITLHAAGSEPRTFGMMSEDQFAPNTCETKSQEAAARMKDVLSKSFDGAAIDIRPSCVRLETRNI